MVTVTAHPATRWTVAAIGVALVLTVTVSPPAGTTDGQLAHVSVATFLGVGVTALGVSLAHSPVRTRTIQYALGWTVAGALALAAGALSGSLVGTMYAHSRHRADLLADERERLSFLNYLLRHNVFNGVQIVTGQTESLRTVMPDDAEPRIDVTKSWTSGLGNLVGRMRQFLDASTGDQDLQAVPLGIVLDTQVAKIEGAFDADITTTGSTPDVTADDGLNQVFECLLVDAVEPDFDILKMGFDDYLTKPVTKADLTDTIDALLSRTQYDESVQDYFALATKKATLEAAKPEEELQGNDEYQNLAQQVQDTRQSVDQTLEKTGDFEAAFRDL